MTMEMKQSKVYEITTEQHGTHLMLSDSIKNAIYAYERMCEKDRSFSDASPTIKDVKMIAEGVWWIAEDTYH